MAPRRARAKPLALALAARLYARGKAERDIKGWRRGAARDGGTIVTFNKALAGGRLAELHITPVSSRAWFTSIPSRP